MLYYSLQLSFIGYSPQAEIDSYTIQSQALASPTPSQAN